LVPTQGQYPMAQYESQHAYRVSGTLLNVSQKKTESADLHHP